MFYRLTLFLIALCLAQSAGAGPWLRDKGTSFTAVSFTSTYALETSTQTYLEYGLSHHTTLLADIRMAQLHYSPDGGHATLSIRRALGNPDRTARLAYELGIGTNWVGTLALPHLRTGLSWGRGIPLRDKLGWLTVEGAVIWPLDAGSEIAKIDATAGITFTDVTAAMLQIYTTHIDGDSFVKIAPSLVLSPKDSKFRIQIGAESEIGAFDNSSIKFGLWREF